MRTGNRADVLEYRYNSYIIYTELPNLAKNRYLIWLGIVTQFG